MPRDMLIKRRSCLAGAAALSVPGLAFAGPVAPPPPALPLLRSQGGLGVIGSQLPNWRKAMAGVCSGTASATVCVVGDSTTMGENAAGVLTQKNVTFYLAQKLQASNPLLVANHSSISGNPGGSGASRLVVDTRFAHTGSVVVGPSPTLGGPLFQMPAGSSITFMPGTAFDTAPVTIYNGQASVQVTNGTAASGTATASLLTVTGTTATASPSNSVTITAITTVYVSSIQTLNSAVPAVNIVNCGFYGGLANQICGTTSNGYPPIAVLNKLQPQLTILNVGINDWNAGTLTATWLSYIQPFVAAAKVYGDVILATGVPSQPNANNAIYMPAYQAALSAYARSINVPFVDFLARWQSWTSANSYGMFSDGLHPTGTYGMPDIAQAYAEVLLAA